MKCVTCGGADVVAAGVQRTEALVGLPGVFCEAVPLERCRSCGEEYLVFPPPSDLLLAVVDLLAALHRPLRGVEIRFLRKRLGWSAGDFAQEFCVDPATVSRWENDKQATDPFRDRMLRLLAQRGLGDLPLRTHRVVVTLDP